MKYIGTGVVLLGMMFPCIAGDVTVEKTGPRQLSVVCSDNGQVYRGKFDFPAGKPVQVTDEYHSSVKPYRKGGSYSMTSPNRLRSMECNTPHSYLPGSLVVKNGKGEAAQAYRQGVDFEIDNVESVFGRLPAGGIGEKTGVYISYRFVKQRIDAVVLRDGKLQLVPGEERTNCPQLPELQKTDKLLLTVWVYGNYAELPGDAVMVIDREKLRNPDLSGTAEKYFPRTLKKLQSGEKVRIVAWGDSITNGGYLPIEKRWTTIFITELRRRFPKADIEFLIVGWPGKTTSTFFNSSAGTKYDYQKKVLDVKPDLIISEFMNDCSLPPKVVTANYDRVLKDFSAIGAEWVAMTPCYSRGNADSPVDNRYYINFLRKFCAKNKIAVADASLYYGKLRYAGIPFRATLVNSVNHPDGRGMQLLADSVLDLFPEK